jgi:hypothetical protein
MIKTVKGELVATCNECGTEEPGGVIDVFRDFVNLLKESGWKIKKDGDEWQHFCPDCEEL